MQNILLNDTKWQSFKIITRSFFFCFGLWLIFSYTACEKDTLSAFLSILVIHLSGMKCAKAFIIFPSLGNYMVVKNHHACFASVFNLIHICDADVSYIVIMAFKLFYFIKYVFSNLSLTLVLTVWRQITSFWSIYVRSFVSRLEIIAVLLSKS